jgi:hypothetical protein
MKKLLFLLALGTGAAVAVQWPELKRYMNMRAM